MIKEFVSDSVNTFVVIPYISLGIFSILFTLKIATICDNNIVRRISSTTFKLQLLFLIVSIVSVIKNIYNGMLIGIGSFIFIYIGETVFKMNGEK